MKAFIVGIMRESAAGSAAASRIGRINRFMGPHIHNLAIVAILSELRPAERRRQAMLSAREAERQPVSCAADSVSWILRLGGHQKTPGRAAPNTCAGSIAGVRRAGFRCFVMAIPAAFPAGCHAPIGCRHAAGDVGFWNSFHGRRVADRSVCWTVGDFAPAIQCRRQFSGLGVIRPSGHKSRCVKGTLRTLGRGQPRLKP